MNLSDEQHEALSTLAVGTAVVRLADQHPEPFLVRVPRSAVRDGLVTDAWLSGHMRRLAGELPARSLTTLTGPSLPIMTHDNNPTMNPLSDESDHTHSAVIPLQRPPPGVITAVPIPDNINNTHTNTHPPEPPDPTHPNSDPPSRETILFLSDLITRPLATTVNRYDTLHLSRRRGNALRTALVRAGLACRGPCQDSPQFEEAMRSAALHLRQRRPAVVLRRRSLHHRADPVRGRRLVPALIDTRNLIM